MRVFLTHQSSQTVTTHWKSKSQGPPLCILHSPEASQENADFSSGCLLVWWTKPTPIHSWLTKAGWVTPGFQEQAASELPAPLRQPVRRGSCPRSRLVRLLPFHVQGESAHVRQDRGHPPKPTPGPRRVRREGALGAWDVGHEHPESRDSWWRGAAASTPSTEVAGGRGPGRTRLWPRLLGRTLWVPPTCTKQWTRGAQSLALQLEWKMHAHKCGNFNFYIEINEVIWGARC